MCIYNTQSMLCVFRVNGKTKCYLFWKIFAIVFSCLFAGECHASVNINYSSPRFAT